MITSPRVAESSAVRALPWILGLVLCGCAATPERYVVLESRDFGCGAEAGLG